MYFSNRGVLITPFHSMLLLCLARGGRGRRTYVRVLEQFCL
jgi:hypothetical protein